MRSPSSRYTSTKFAPEEKGKAPRFAEPLKYCEITGYQLALRTLGRLEALSRNVPLMDETTDLASSADR